MKFQVSDILSNNIRKLASAEAGEIWKTIEQYKQNPAFPGLSCERVNNAKSDNVWSIRAGRDLRVILYRGKEYTSFVYADHHDAAYRWATTHRVEVHATTNALQVVTTVEEIRKVVREVYVEPEAEPMFAKRSEAYLLSLGVPKDWLPFVREEIKTQDHLFHAIDQLPESVGERLMSLALGEVVSPPVIKSQAPPEEQPDSLGQFFPLTEDVDLKKLLQAPFDTWLIFLHPSQRKVAYTDFSGPLKVTGTAGTGKTVAALHRAFHLASQGKKVLVCTFVNVLAENLVRQLDLLCKDQPGIRKLISLTTVHSEALRLVRTARKTAPRMLSGDDVRRWIDRSPLLLQCPLPAEAIYQEWMSVVEAQGITNWESYRSASRAGLGRPMQVDVRRKVWEVLENVFSHFHSENAMTWSFLCSEARKLIVEDASLAPYDAVIVDETQDLGAQELKFLHALAPNALSLFGDGGQRIYARAISFKQLGIPVTGRSFSLKINYRTTSEIRAFADKLQDTQSDNLDGAKESRKGVVSLMNGEHPVTKGFSSQKEGIEWVCDRISDLVARGESTETIAILGRTSEQLKGYTTELKQRALEICLIGKDQGLEKGKISLLKMHGGKGLEFRSVFVVDVNEDVLPFPKSIEGIDDPILKAEAESRERNLLYVSCTRARDFLTVTWTGKPSIFLKPVLETK